MANGSSLTRAEIMEKFEGLLGRSFDGDALSFSIVGYAPAYFAALYTLKQHRAAVFIHRDLLSGMLSRKCLLLGVPLELDLGCDGRLQSAFNLAGCSGALSGRRGGRFRHTERLDSAPGLNDLFLHSPAVCCTIISCVA